ncbi:hypothetical protein [Ancylobacter vacuolatus]|uniref:Uncharacterized protein n=1 Tax=Ancylobacter vacuolatus TaxID=223389 RepID=A0ABU0DMP4_9HYPH|nr:hypothetical protein [Ancylobacter vacuolatus]MDQ0349718.1 hypothetical protein [Ancylobacter vacuolatus]
MAEEAERIVFDRKLGMIFVRLGHTRVHGSPEYIEALGAFLFRAAEESRAGLHDAPQMPRSTWAPGEIKDIADG